MMVVLMTALGLLLQTPQAPRALAFAEPGWDLRGASIARHDGRDVLQVETGFGFRRDVRLDDGTIDFDVQLTDRRSFVYLYFRAESDGEREEIYLRPHKANLPDAVQYAPVWQGRSAWQLYHGPGATVAAPFEAGAWTHVRLVAQGRSAAVFIGDMTAPAMVVPRLAREPRAGYIALGGFLPRGVPGSGPIARFANVIVTPGHVPFDFTQARADAMQAAGAEAGVIRQWEVSTAFAPPAESAAGTMPEPPAAFQTVDAEAGGLVPLHRHVRMPEGANAAAAVARVRVRATQAGAYAFDLGFSDIATVFVNGTPVFRGDASYSFDRPRREGLIGFDQARLYLPLKAGDNELAIVVSDSFGGWGLMGRFVDGAGLTVSAR